MASLCVGVSFSYSKPDFDPALFFYEMEVCCFKMLKLSGAMSVIQFTGVGGI